MRTTSKLMIAALALSSTAALAQTDTTRSDANAREGVPQYRNENMNNNMNNTVNRTWENTKEGARETWDATKQGANNAWQNTKNATNQAYTEVKQFVNGSQKPASGVPYLAGDSVSTAESLIGADVMGPNNEKVASVDDIIVGPNGSIQYVVLTDGGFLGLADKLVALRYNDVMTNSSGKLMTNLTEQDYERFTEFNYDSSKASPTVATLSPNMVSVKRLMDGELLDNQGKEIADIENVTIENGQVGHVVISFGKVFGMGGHQAAVPFTQASVQKNGDVLDMRMNYEQSQSFNKLKQMIKS